MNLPRLLKSGKPLKIYDTFITLQLSRSLKDKSFSKSQVFKEDDPLVKRLILDGLRSSPVSSRGATKIITECERSSGVTLGNASLHGISCIVGYPETEGRPKTLWLTTFYMPNLVSSESLIPIKYLKIRHLGRDLHRLLSVRKHANRILYYRSQVAALDLLTSFRQIRLSLDSNRFNLPKIPLFTSGRVCVGSVNHGLSSLTNPQMKALITGSYRFTSSLSSPQTRIIVEDHNFSRPLTELVCKRDSRISGLLELSRDHMFRRRVGVGRGRGTSAYIRYVEDTRGEN